MQRRAAAIYATFFIVIAAGAYGVVGLAQEPTVTVDDPAHSLSAGDTIEADGRTYTVGQVQAATNEGNDLRSVDLSWVNESGVHTASLENGSTVASESVSWSGQTTRNGTYNVTIESAEEPTTFSLTQAIDVPARLAADPAVENQTVTRADGREYVVYRENGTTQPLSEYLPEPERREFAEGDPLRYEGNATTVRDVSDDAVTLAWTAPVTNTLSLEEGATTTLGGTEYVAHFPDNGTVELSTDLGAYERQVATVETYHQRMSGFWGIAIVSGLAAIFLLGAAYLPSRY